MKLLLSIVISILVASSAEEKLPLCSVCTCKFKENKFSAEVICNKDTSTIWTQNSTWINPSNNESYDYSSVSLLNQEIYVLNYTFLPSNLRYLSLANSNIRQIANSPFRNLQNMNTLILSYNELEILSPHTLKGLYMEERLMPLKSLKVLKLDHNKIHSLHMDIFEHTTDLEILDISYNPFKIIDKQTTLALSSLAMLKELYLGYTEINTLPDQLLHTPRYIEILDLSGNPLTAIPSTLGETHNLTTLYINDTGFMNMTKENGFPEIPSLKVLYMCNNRELQSIGKEALAGLSGLQELSICNNIKLTILDDFALAKINQHGGATWPMIKKLNLYNNKLAYLDSDLLSRWDMLTDIDLNGNPWTCECENQWFVDELAPLYLKINPEREPEFRCGAPVEMQGDLFVDLHARQYKMRCLDIYGARPETDAMLLVGVLLGVLIGLPVILFIIYAYQRQWLSLLWCDNSPASYSRRFYSSTARDEDL
ncbi:hypothetical protein GWI33_004663 [Rhynchophorus ferrugineus]|uniref:Uncharacterized protein n=1 Tax=Rhynchophorus ferrugineus TaxID=354439 RepID=A0A834IYQ6_RHYFE|nr:hypothetical protein GWI33_004663 [Rhynchophorus ferrugineus]